MPAREDVRNSACAFLLGVSVAVVHPLVLVAYGPEHKDAVDTREPVLIACYALFAFGVVYGVSCSRQTLEVGGEHVLGVVSGVHIGACSITIPCHTITYETSVCRR